MNQRSAWVNRFLASLQQDTLLGWVLRYSLAVVAVGVAMGLRLALAEWIGPGLPAYITFYPMVMVAALLAGLGPGLAATALSALTAAYWVLPPVGQFAIASPVDRVGLVIFAGMGLFLSVVAELYRRNRNKAAAYDREAALRETRREKEFLANLLEHASHPFAVGYPDGRLGRCNQAFEQLTGYTAAELSALDWSTTLTPPEWRDLERQKLDELHRTGLPIRYEKEYVRKDGSRVLIELLVHLVSDAAGKPEYYYSFIADITERKRAEEALRESEAKYRNLFENMTEEVHFWKLVRDEHGRIKTWRLVDANPPTLKTWGRTLDEIRGKTTDEIFGPGATEHYLPVVQKIMAEGSPYFFEDYFPHLDRHFRFASVPVGDCFITTGADITSIKKAELALCESEERLASAGRQLAGQRRVPVCPRDGRQGPLPLHQRGHRTAQRRQRRRRAARRRYAARAESAGVQRAADRGRGAQQTRTVRLRHGTADAAARR